MLIIDKDDEQVRNFLWQIVTGSMNNAEKIDSICAYLNHFYFGGAKTPDEKVTKDFEIVPKVEAKN